MPKFGAASLKQRATCDKRLQAILDEAIEVMDFSIVEGHRDEQAQNDAYAKGFSKVRWPHGKHNSKPSLAVDIAPYPIDWSDKASAIQRFVFLAGIMITIAHQHGYRLRWGGDWNMNMDMRDEGSFRDYPHFEILDD